MTPKAPQPVRKPDEPRGKGRDDYPVTTLWGALLLTIVLRHPTIEACLGDLQRNAALRKLIGIESETQRAGGV